MGNKEFSGAQSATIDAQTTVARKRAGLSSLCLHKQKAGGITLMIRPRLFQCPVGKTTQLLLWPRLRRHHPVDPVIYHQISVVLPGMLNQPVSQIAHSVEP